MALQSLDIVVVLKLVALGERTWSYPSLAAELSISPSGVHKSVRRAVESKLLDSVKKRPRINAVEEFLVHGVKYVFPPQRGGLTRGMPTSHAAQPLASEIVQSSDNLPVWPYAKGTVRGYAFFPLHKTVPIAAEKDIQLYELLALLDAIRGGRAREASIAVTMIKERLRPKNRRKIRSQVLE